MTRSSPFVMTLSEAERAELQRRACCYTLPHAEVVRAKVVLVAADGLENTVIAGDACGAGVRHSGSSQVGPAVNQEPRLARAGIPVLPRPDGE